MKNIYEEPKLDIIVFSTEDIITTSGGFDGEDDTLNIISA
jgi:hypothetical protein